MFAMFGYDFLTCPRPAAYYSERLTYSLKPIFYIATYPNLTDRLWLAEPETDGQNENTGTCAFVTETKSERTGELSPRKEETARRACARPNLQTQNVRDQKDSYGSLFSLRFALWGHS